MDKVVKDYCQKLDKLKIGYEVVQHPELKSAQEVQDFLGLSLADGFSTLLLKTEKGFVSVIRRDDCQLDYKKIKELFKVKDVRIASKEEFKELTGLEVGTAQILIPGVKFLLDKKLFEKKMLTGGSGSFSCSLRYAANDLKNIPNSRVVDIVQDEKELKDRYSILTGITPSGTGEIHIGNYFGAVVPFLELQKKANQVHFFMADLHGLTTVQDKQQMQSNVETQILSYLACGLDPKKTVFYRQSDIPQHTELQSILNNVTPLGLIKRCHAYKDKLQKGFDEDKVNMGLFSYPVLMAADILLYDPDYVPVGEDQRQHIEVTRDIAERFNSIYGETFKLPEIYNVEETAKIIGTDGKRKMSKTLGNIVSVLADEKVIKKQIMGCYTDPKRKRATDPGRVEGNPVFVYHDLINEDKKEVEELKKRYREGKVGDVEVKEKLYRAFMKRFKVERQRYAELKAKPEVVKTVLADGAEKARKMAVKKMMLVRERIGIENKYSFYKYEK